MTSPQNLFLPVPPERIRKILKVLRKRHRLHLRGGEVFTYSGRMSHGESAAETVLHNKDKSYVASFQCRVDNVVNDIQNAQDALDLATDFLDEVVTEFFEKDRDMHLDLDWKEYEFGATVVWFRGAVRNQKVEEMSDAFLREHGVDPESL